MTPSDLIPEATAATNDFVCWLWAAYPPRDGRIHVRRIADDLGVDERTVRRWVAGPTRPHKRHHDQILRRLTQRAILRGHGTYLWPDLDPSTAYRHDARLQRAQSNQAAIERGTYPATWQTNGTLAPHEVLLAWYPKAHVYAVHAVSTRRARQRIERTAEVLQELGRPNRYAAELVKYRTLIAHGQHRCIAPQELVVGGRTETWRAVGGAGNLLA